ncbi:MAG: hypothetical protein EOL87_05150 [Spartobacteria bacterium]|nr:hypothetical protein [Spartobacteria bacterium]
MALDPPEESEEVGCPMWMVSFGDAMSLLVTFFVMLLSFTSFEEAQLAELLGALRGGLNAIPAETSEGFKGRSGKNMGSKYEANVPAEELSKLSPYDQSFQKEFSKNDIGSSSSDEFYLRLLEEGLSLSFKTETMFEPGTTRLIESRESIFGVMVDMVRNLDNEIRIVSVLPANVKVLDDRVSTAWGLGAERAAAIQLKLMEIYPQFSTDRFSLGTRVEIPDNKPRAASALPQERMEITFVGYRDLPVLNAEDFILKGNLD